MHFRKLTYALFRRVAPLGRQAHNLYFFLLLAAQHRPYGGLQTSECRFTYREIGAAMHEAYGERPSPSSLSHALQELEQARLVTRRLDGRNVIFRILDWAELQGRSVPETPIAPDEITLPKTETPTGARSYGGAQLSPARDIDEIPGTDKSEEGEAAPPSASPSLPYQASTQLFFAWLKRMSRLPADPRWRAEQDQDAVRSGALARPELVTRLLAFAEQSTFWKRRLQSMYQLLTSVYQDYCAQSGVPDRPDRLRAVAHSRYTRPPGYQTPPDYYDLADATPPPLAHPA